MCPLNVPQKSGNTDFVTANRKQLNVQIMLRVDKGRTFIIATICWWYLDGQYYYWFGFTYTVIQLISI